MTFVRATLLALLFCVHAHAQERFSIRGKDWQIPHAQPKPLVWYEDLAKLPGTESKRSTKQVEAVEQLRLGDEAKSGEQYEEAVKFYEKALLLDPTLAMASYQLSCNYSLWGKKDKAKKAFDHAVEIGFSDYGSAFDDDELGTIRNMTDFSAKMKIIRERYLKVQPNLIGQPVAFKPSGIKPEKGWPVIVFLHGMGDTNVHYFEESKAWAKLGVIAIALPGSVPAMVDSFSWSAYSVEPTHKDIQACMMSPLLNGLIDKERISLFGFSQGAAHAIGLLRTEPKSYSAVIALSPGGKLDQFHLPGKLDNSQPKRLYYIHGKQEPHAPFAAAYKKACETAKWQFKLMVHPGGHHFPETWDDERTAAMKFLHE